MLLVCLFFLPMTVQSQRAAKKYKHAPDETFVLLFGEPNATFDVAQFPHLKFYYLPDISSGTAPDFITRWADKSDIAEKEHIQALLIDSKGVVAYQNFYHKAIIEGFRGDEFQTSLLTKPRIVPDKQKLEEFLKTHVTKAKDAKVDKKKMYTPGTEPTFKSWKKGDIMGMELPDFNVKSANGEEVSIKTLLAGKPSLIIFTAIDKNTNYGANKEAAENLKDNKVTAKGIFSAFVSASSSDAFPIPWMWHIENVLYNYYPPRNK